MTTPLRLPADPAALADLAHDVHPFTVAEVAARIGPRAVAALEREDRIPARLAAGTDHLGLLIRLFLLGEDLSPAEVTRALPRSESAARQWGVIRAAGDRVRAGID